MYVPAQTLCMLVAGNCPPPSHAFGKNNDTCKFLVLLCPILGLVDSHVERTAGLLNKLCTGTFSVWHFIEVNTFRM